MSDADTLLVFSVELGPLGKRANWLVALSRNDSEWRQAQRVQTDGKGWSSCSLSDSRVLVGQWRSTYMELFRVESGPHIAHVHRIHVPEQVLLILRDVRQRHARGDVIRGQVGAFASTAATGWRNSRASVEATQLSSVAR